MRWPSRPRNNSGFVRSVLSHGCDLDRTRLRVIRVTCSASPIRR